MFFFNYLPQPKFNRPGSEKDCNRLNETFSKLGYDVIVYNDLRAYEVIESVNTVAKEDFSNYGSLVICLLSHGDEGNNNFLKFSRK